jgi:hypothetical protein
MSSMSSGRAASAAWPELERRASRAFEALQRERTCEVALGVAMAVYAAVELWLTRGTTLFADGVDLFVNNRGLDPGALLRPLNGHLILMERGVYAVGLPLFDTHFLVYRLVEIVGAAARRGR